MNITTDPSFLVIAIVILAICVIVLLFITIRLHLKMKKFLVAIDAHSIADSLDHVSTGLKDLEKFQKTIEAYLAEAEKRIQRSVRSVHTVRFNPFHGTGEGGNQSFATAFLSESGDGVIISSLYSRDRVSVFSKPIKNFSSEHEMSDEEKEALEKAVGKLK